MLRRPQSTPTLLAGLLLGCTGASDADNELANARADAAADALTTMRADAQVQELLAGLSAIGCVPDVSQENLFPLIEDPAAESITVFSKKVCVDERMEAGILARTSGSQVEYSAAFALPQRETSDGRLFPEYESFVGFVAFGGELRDFVSFREWSEELRRDVAVARVAPELETSAVAPELISRAPRHAGDSGPVAAQGDGETCSQCIARVITEREADIDSENDEIESCEEANAELEAQAAEQDLTTEWADFLLAAATGESRPVATGSSDTGALALADCPEGSLEALEAAAAQDDECQGPCGDVAQCDPANGIADCIGKKAVDERLVCHTALNCVRVPEEQFPNLYYVCATEADGEFIADGAVFVDQHSDIGHCPGSN